MAQPRIVSLLPSATEIAVALGLGESLVGRSHECDYPLFVKALPVVTSTRLEKGLTSRQIDDRDKLSVDTKMAGSASYFAHEAACDVTRAAMEIHGGMGVMRELPIEMYLRNAYNMLHSDGGIIMKKLKVMRAMGMDVHATNGSEKVSI